HRKHMKKRTPSTSAGNQLVERVRKLHPATLVGFDWTKSKFRVGYVVMGLGLGALLASGGEPLAAMPVNCTLNKPAFLFDSNLRFGEPHGKIFILDFTSQGFEFAKPANKGRATNSVIPVPRKAVANQSANQHSDDSHQSKGDWLTHLSDWLLTWKAEYIWSFT